MKTTLAICLLLLSAACSAQIIRKAGEPDSAFIARVMPAGLSPVDDDLLYKQMFATTEWTKDKSLFAFYAHKYLLPGDDQEYRDILGYLYVPTGRDSYRRVFIDTFENEGGTAEILSVFFANADHDSARELVILLGWPVTHLDVNGELYETRIYDNITATPGHQPPPKLAYLPAISKKVSGGFNGTQDGQEVTTDCTNAAQVRKKLRRLGY